MAPVDADVPYDPACEWGIDPPAWVWMAPPCEWVSVADGADVRAKSVDEPEADPDADDDFEEDVSRSHASRVAALALSHVSRLLPLKCSQSRARCDSDSSHDRPPSRRCDSQP